MGYPYTSIVYLHQNWIHEFKTSWSKNMVLPSKKTIFKVFKQTLNTVTIIIYKFRLKSPEVYHFIIFYFVDCILYGFIPFYLKGVWQKTKSYHPWPWHCRKWIMPTHEIYPPSYVFKTLSPLIDLKTKVDFKMFRSHSLFWVELHFYSGSGCRL